MRPVLRGQQVAVYGLARSGVAAARLLLREGARVVGVDARSEAELGQAAATLRAEGAALRVGSPPPLDALESFDLVVVSPGVPLALPELARARERRVPVWGEVELASRFLGPGRVVGITGTNGKSTTTALAGELFRQAGLNAFVGGNLGRPLCEAVLATEAPFEVHVVELSSFQLEGIEQLRVHAAALLNLTPDHLDRYESHGAYGEAKARIFRNQQAGDFAVVNADDAAVVELSRRARGPVHGFTLGGAPAAAHLASLAARDGAGAFRLSAGGRSLRFTLGSRALRGEHNLQNAMAATLLALHAGVEPSAIQRGLDSYPGLPHRLELARTLDGVEWINDSKATNVDSTLVALRAFEGGVWLIAGGKGKGAPYAPMVDASAGRVKGVLTLGQDAPAIEEAYRGRAEVYPCGTLEGAVRRARELARPGEVVLLSPACASYDQFRNFEDRGETFKRLVGALTP